MMSCVGVRDIKQRSCAELKKEILTLVTNTSFVRRLSCPNTLRKLYAVKHYSAATGLVHRLNMSGPSFKCSFCVRNKIDPR
jgi:hypothetical protein